jgi:hypothetical protein
MMKRSSKFAKCALLAFVFVAVCATGQAYADAATDARIEKLETALMQLQAELQELKAERKTGKSVSEKQIETVVTKVLEDKGATGTVPGWLNKIKFSGDFRYRNVNTDTVDGGDWDSGRIRNRIRVRLGLGIEISDDLDVNLRFAGGTMSPASTNQTLTDSFSTKEFLVDRAYIDWHPGSMDGLSIFAGKMKNPFYRPISTQIIWDTDVSPEGFAGTYAKDISNDTKVYFTGSGFWVDESSSGVDTFLWGSQSYIKKQLDEERYILGGVTYYDYSNIEGRGDLNSTWSTSSNFFGNTKADRDGEEVFASDFNIFEMFGEYGFNACGMPITVGGNWIRNFAADSGRDTAWMAGFTFNKAKEAGSWQGRYNYRDTEADAVVGIFTDSDFANGVTNSKGSELGFDYMLAKNVMGSLTYSLAEKGEQDEDVRKLQADVKVKF